MDDTFPQEPVNSTTLTLKQKVLLKIVEAAIRHDGMYRARNDFRYLDEIADKIIEADK